MTTQLETRLKQELSATTPKATNPMDSTAFADKIIARVDRRARRHQTIYAGTIAAFIAAISAVAWSARNALTISTGGDGTHGELAGSGDSTTPASSEITGSEITGSEIAGSEGTGLNPSDTVSWPGTIEVTTIEVTSSAGLALIMLIGLPLLAAMVSWRRPANSALSELGRVGRAVLVMLLTFFGLVSFTGLLSTVAEDRSAPTLVRELHNQSPVAATLLLFTAVLFWLIRFDFGVLREAITTDTLVAIILAFFIPVSFASMSVTGRFSFLNHSVIAAVILYWCFLRLPRINPLKRSRKIAFIVIAAVFIAVGFFLFTYQVLFVPGESMAPTITSGSRVIVDKLDTDVDRGDIVIVIVARGDRALELIRRVGAVGGDSIAASDGELIVNGEVAEYFIDRDAGGSILTDFTAVRVPVGEVFLIGDNYASSADSRFEGTVPIDRIVGTVSEFNAD